MSEEGGARRPSEFDADLPWPNRDDAGVSATVRPGSREATVEPLDEVGAVSEPPPRAVPSGPPPSPPSSTSLVYVPELQQVIDRRLAELDDLANDLQKDFQRIALQQIEETQELLARSEQELQAFARRRVIDVDRVSEAALARLDAMTAERVGEFQVTVEKALEEIRRSTAHRLTEFERTSGDRLSAREHQAVLAVEQAEQQALGDIERAGPPAWATTGIVVALVTACAGLGLAILSLALGR